jgi:phosphatidylglycerophosphatase C
VRLAVFDLDGTITRHDTLLPYVLGFLARRPWRLPRVLLVLPPAAAFALHLIDRGRLKGAWIALTLGGCHRAALARWTGEYVRRVRARGVFADALDAIAAHARAGDRLVLMSASTDLYVPELARALGFHEVICTGVRWAGEHLIGTLATPNRRGAEKARCLGELAARFPQLPTIAYGNAASDLEHLVLAGRGVLVNGSPRARRAARRLGLTTVIWR